MCFEDSLDSMLFPYWFSDYFTFKLNVKKLIYTTMLWYLNEHLEVKFDDNDKPKIKTIDKIFGWKSFKIVNSKYL